MSFRRYSEMFPLLPFKRMLTAATAVTYLAVATCACKTALATDVCVTPVLQQSQSQIVLCVGATSQLTWQAAYCGQAISSTNECTAQGPTISWPNGGPTVTIGPFDTPGVHTITSPTVQAKWTFVAKKSGVVCPPDVVKEGTGTANVIVYKMTQFSPKSSSFPKCWGDPISISDFTIVTDPAGYEGAAVVSGLTTEPTGASGAPLTGDQTLTATAQLCGQTLTTQYHVLCDSTTQVCEQPTDKHVHVPYSNVVMKEQTGGDLSLMSANPSVEYYHEYLVNGVSDGTATDHLEYTSGESDCGGGIATTQTQTWSVTGQVGINWTALKDVVSLTGGISFTTGGSLSVTFSHAGIPNKKIQQKCYSHPIEISLTGTKVQNRQCYKSNDLIHCDDWVADGSTFSETEDGELPQETVLCQRCCGGSTTQ